jgi:hypothetical protein
MPMSHNIRVLFPFMSLGDMEDTCALDVADSGEHDLSEVAYRTGLSKERVRQIQNNAIEKFDHLKR